ncbi:hypothetical protein AAVH_37359 [Aphelenchoides avenae]|nr:hypothetical protein AAVH_37359 [Aphelenchus avenae]
MSDKQGRRKMVNGVEGSANGAPHSGNSDSASGSQGDGLPSYDEAIKMETKAPPPAPPPVACYEVILTLICCDEKKYIMHVVPGTTVDALIREGVAKAGGSESSCAVMEVRFYEPSLDEYFDATISDPVRNGARYVVELEHRHENGTCDCDREDDCSIM